MQDNKKTPPSGRIKSANRKTSIGRVTIGLALISIVSKLFGFAEKLIVAHFFGTEDQADVYFATMGIVLSLFFLTKELIYPSVLPVYAETLRTSCDSSAALFKRLFFWLTVVLVPACLALIFTTDTVTSLLMPGFTEQKRHLASSLLKCLAPAMLFLCLSSFTYAILNCRKQFFKAALPETGLKLMVAVGLMVLAPFLGLYALALVLGMAALVVIVIQLLFLPETKQLFQPSCLRLCRKTPSLARERAIFSPGKGGEAGDVGSIIDTAGCSQAEKGPLEARSSFLTEPITDQAFHRVLTLMRPLALGVVFSHVSGLVDNMLASKLPTGHLAYLGYSKKLMDAILLVGPVALVTVMYAQLSHLASTFSKTDFAHLFTKAFRLILFVGIPAALLLVSLRQPIIKLLFERGKFTAESTLGTSNALWIYSIGLVTFSIEALVVYSFYARSNTRTPVWTGIAGVLLDILLAVTLVKPFGFRAIAWAYVISKSVKVLILLFLMNRDICFIKARELILFLGKIALAVIPATYLLRHLTFSSITPSLANQALFHLAIPSIGFLMVYCACSYILQIKELRELPAMILSKRSKSSQHEGGSNS